MSRCSCRYVLPALLRDALLIVILAALVGAAVNGRLLRRIWSERAPVVVADPGPGVDLLPMPASLEELRTLQQDAVLLIDARAAELYRQGHLPVAYSLPWGEIETRLEAFQAEVPVERALITYCSGYGCEDSFLLAQHLMAAGYEDVRVYEGGLPEWRDAGLPVEEGHP